MAVWKEGPTSLKGTPGGETEEKNRSVMRIDCNGDREEQTIHFK